MLVEKIFGEHATGNLAVGGVQWWHAHAKGRVIHASQWTNHRKVHQIWASFFTVFQNDKILPYFHCLFEIVDDESVPGLSFRLNISGRIRGENCFGGGVPTLGMLGISNDASTSLPRTIRLAVPLSTVIAVFVVVATITENTLQRGDHIFEMFSDYCNSFRFI